MSEQNRRTSDDKIFEMHGTIAALSENIKHLRDDMSTVPMNAAEIIKLKDKVHHLEEDMIKVQREQKVIEMASIFFRVAKWLAGVVIAVAGAWAVLEGLGK
jgi:hypothetical protein